MRNKHKQLPLVYSCSGCSSAAQMANDLAIALDRKEIAEMSCIAGVGGDVKPLVVTAKSGRRIIAIDGCPLKCVEHCLARHGIKPDEHFVLSDYGIKKVFHGEYDKSEAEDIFADILYRV
ncbi:MAG: zinc-binding protein [Haliscomenobacteraceae bacterium CHB4]|nr:zinc-binding protein [Haliscomenobacteraceae bacterium CHB4]